jgi:peptide/nickel transport system substrate-binding protein
MLHVTSRHRFLPAQPWCLLAALAACIALAPGCRPASPVSAAAAKGGGGELRIVLPDEPVTLNPNLLGDEIALSIGGSIFNHLVALDADHRPIPALAETWSVSGDGRTYTFRLRAGVRWHDGDPFDADDVRFTFETLRGGDGSWPGVPRHVRVDIDTPDAFTVHMRLDTPWAPFLPSLGLPGHAIMPAHIYRGHDWRTHQANMQPVGTGPFKFHEWVPGERVVLVANTSYHGRGPFLDRLVFVTAPDSAAGAQAMLRGEADLLSGRPPASLLKRLEQHADLMVRSYPTLSRYQCIFNLRRPPLDDRRVREAIARAIDRSALVGTALAGYGAPALGFFTPSIPWAYNGDARVPAYSPELAGALLDAAGLPDRRGRPRLRLTLATGQLSPYTELAPLLRDQLESIGIEVTLVILPLNDFLTRVLQHQDFDIALIGGTHGPDPDFLRSRFGSGEGENTLGYGNAEFDALVDEAARVPDMAERAGAYFRAQAILADDLPVLPLAESIRIAVARRGLTGLAFEEARGLVPEHDYSLVRLASAPRPETPDPGNMP